jgi:hypothetical protein
MPNLATNKTSRYITAASHQISGNKTIILDLECTAAENLSHLTYTMFSKVKLEMPWRIFLTGLV